MGVLASGSRRVLRNYCRWAPFRAGPLRGMAMDFRANLFDSGSFVHPARPLNGGKLSDLTFVSALARCKALAKRSCRKLCIFLALGMSVRSMAARTRDSVPFGYSTERAMVARRNRFLTKVASGLPDGLLEGELQAAAPPVFSRAQISFPSHFR